MIKRNNLFKDIKVVSTPDEIWFLDYEEFRVKFKLLGAYPTDDKYYYWIKNQIANYDTLSSEKKHYLHSFPFFSELLKINNFYKSLSYSVDWLNDYIKTVNFIKTNKHIAAIIPCVNGNDITEEMCNHEEKKWNNLIVNTEMEKLYLNKLYEDTKIKHYWELKLNNCIYRKDKCQKKKTDIKELELENSIARWINQQILNEHRLFDIQIQLLEKLKNWSWIDDYTIKLIIKIKEYINLFKRPPFYENPQSINIPKASFYYYCFTESKLVNSINNIYIERNKRPRFFNEVIKILLKLGINIDDYSDFDKECINYYLNKEHNILWRLEKICFQNKLTDEQKNKLSQMDGWCWNLVYSEIKNILLNFTKEQIEKHKKGLSKVFYNLDEVKKHLINNYENYFKNELNILLKKYPFLIYNLKIIGREYVKKLFYPLYVYQNEYEYHIWLYYYYGFKKHYSEHGDYFPSYIYELEYWMEKQIELYNENEFNLSFRKKELLKRIDRWSFDPINTYKRKKEKNINFSYIGAQKELRDLLKSYPKIIETEILLIQSNHKLLIKYKIGNYLKELQNDCIKHLNLSVGENIEYEETLLNNLKKGKENKENKENIICSNTLKRRDLHVNEKSSIEEIEQAIYNVKSKKERASEIRDYIYE
jgi:hypothetical protein